MRPCAASATRLARPRARLAPPVANARCSTSGFVAAKLRRRERVDVLPGQEQEPTPVLFGQRGQSPRARSGIRRRAGSPASSTRSRAARATPAPAKRRSPGARPPPRATRMEPGSPGASAAMAAADSVQLAASRARLHRTGYFAVALASGRPALSAAWAHRLAKPLPGDAESCGVASGRTFDGLRSVIALRARAAGLALSARARRARSR